MEYEQGEPWVSERCVQSGGPGGVARLPWPEESQRCQSGLWGMRSMGSHRGKCTMVRLGLKVECVQ